MVLLTHFYSSFFLFILFYLSPGKDPLAHMIFGEGHILSLSFTFGKQLFEKKIVSVGGGNRVGKHLTVS